MNGDEVTDMCTSSRQYLMMVWRPLTWGVLSNTLSMSGSVCVCWADARRALRHGGEVFRSTDIIVCLCHTVRETLSKSLNTQYIYQHT